MSRRVLFGRAVWFNRLWLGVSEQTQSSRQSLLTSLMTCSTRVLGYTMEVGISL